jgi:CRISPR-associated protein Cmr6
LSYAGAGAKTAAGYGSFRLLDQGADPAPPAPGRELRWTTELRLVTPAFLAGADQAKDDCTLHPGTLRGLLRWWWRTLHAGHVPVAELRRLETLVWGGTGQSGGQDSGQGSAVAVHVMPCSGNTGRDHKEQPVPKQVAVHVMPCSGNTAPVSYSKKNEEKRHNLKSPGNRTVQGLFYASYGMDDDPKKPSRHYLKEGNGWTVTLAARPVRQDEDGEISAELILGQARAALWLLCRYGGVGSRARKGFGSLADANHLGIASIEDCKRLAAGLRRAARVASGKVPEAMAIEDALFAETRLDDSDPWRCLDQAGALLRDFTKRLDKDRRLALGLPRKVGNRPQSAGKGERHAAPAWWHLAKEGGGFTLRVTAFPACHLPDEATSRKVLRGLLDWIQPGVQAAGPSAKSGGAAQDNGAGAAARKGRRGTVDGEPCIVRREQRDGLIVVFDYDTSSEEFVTRDKFIPE